MTTKTEWEKSFNAVLDLLIPYLSIFFSQQNIDIGVGMKDHTMLRIKAIPLPSNFILFRENVSKQLKGINRISPITLRIKSNGKDAILKLLIFLINFGFYQYVLDLIQIFTEFQHKPIHQYAISLSNASDDILGSIWTSGNYHIFQFCMPLEPNVPRGEIQGLPRTQQGARNTLRSFLFIYLQIKTKSECPKISTGYWMMFRSEDLHYIIKDMSIDCMKRLISDISIQAPTHVCIT